MFDEKQIVTVTWYSGNKKYYTDLGYNFTKFNDQFQVLFYLTKHRSKLWVKVVCDYCGEEYTTRYGNYQIALKRGKAACKKCKYLKIADSLQEKYGSTSLWGSPMLQEKAKEAMKKKYGCEYFIQSAQGQEKFKKTMKEKYGVENPIYVPEFQAKAKNSMYINNSTPSSIPERKIVDMFIELYGIDNCFPGYPVDRVNLDCLLIINNIKIDVEYDGWYWHQNTQDYDRKRNHWLISLGYKILRIKGNKHDDLPSHKRLKEEVDYLLEGHSIGYIDMNKQDEQIVCSHVKT